MNIKNIDLFFSDNPNPMWIYDPTDLSIKRANDSACALYGYSEEEMQALTIMDLRPEGEQDKLKNHLSKPTSGFNNAGIWKHRKKGGDIIFVRVLSTPITHGDNTYKMITVQDVTKEIQYQKELDMLFENSLDGIMLTSPEGLVFRANRAACNILGMQEAEIKRLGREGIVEKDEKLEKALKRRKETGNFSGELSFIHKTGRKIPVELTTSVYTNLQGEQRTSMIFRDITGRKETEQKLQESLDRYHYATKATNDAIYDWDIENDQLYLGEGFSRIFGYDTGENVYSLKEYTDFVHPEDHPNAQQDLDNILQNSSRNHWEHEYRLKRPDGGYTHVIENGYIIRDKEGKAVRMIGAVRDVTERRKLKELLEDAQQLARIGAWEVDFVNDNMYWSPITKQIHEVPPNFNPDLETGIKFYKEGESRESIRKAVQEAIENGTSWDVELQIVTGKGNERWIRAIGKSEITEGECTRLYGSFQDIQDRKEAQLNLQKAYEERRQILERISEAFFAVDRDWTVTYWNKQAEKVIGLARQEVIGKNLWKEFPEAKDLKFFPEYKRALKEQVIVQFEEYFHPLEQWLEVSAYPSPEGLSVFFRDVTERKKAEQSLQESLHKNQLILESTGEGIYGIDPEGRCTFMNQAAANMLGYAAEECIGTNMHELVHYQYANGKPYPEAHCPIFISKNRLESCRITDEVFWRSDGTCFNVEYISNPMIEDGDIKGAVVIFSNITKRKQQEKDLQESLKEKETLLSEIHHRVKNNLAVVSSLMQLQAYKEDDESLIQKINDSISRIQTMASIHEMLYQSESFSRLKIDEHLKKLVTNITDTFQIQRSIEVKFDLQKISLNINQAIPFSLIINEVVTNVFKHAFDHNQTEAVLSVTLKEENNLIRIHVMDNGKGLPQDVTKTKESLGMQLIDALSTQLHATYKYYSANGKTHFTLNFEKKEVKGSGNVALL